MKVAVCISGIPRSGIGVSEQKNTDFVRNFKALQQNFKGADFYMGTWKGYGDIVAKYFPAYWEFEEPEATYNPYLDMAKKYMVSDKMRKFSDIYRSKPHLHERVRHQTKQILCHANMVNRLPKVYDIIVRARFDTFTYLKADFTSYVQRVAETKGAIGFACLKPHWKTFNIARKLLVGNGNFDWYLFDSLIIHHSLYIDTDYIFQLHKEQKLCPAEFGWYQVLSRPYNANHTCISGWANADRCVLVEFLNEN